MMYNVNEVKVWVANLGKYTEGTLKGDWISLPATEEEIKAFLVNVVGLNEQYEEYALFDWENVPFEISEYTNIFTLNEQLEEYFEIVDSAGLEMEDVKAITEYYGYNEGLEIINEDRIRVWHDCQTMEDVAYQLIDEIGMENVSNKDFYFDTVQFKRDLEIDGFFSELEREYEEENGLEAESYEMDEEEKNWWVDELEATADEQTMERYFDYEAFGRDMGFEGTFIESTSGNMIEVIW